MNKLKRVVYIDGSLQKEKYVLKKEYDGFGIYERMTPNGWLVHQDWLITNGYVTLEIGSYNSLCYEELLDMIDSYKETGKFGVKAFNRGNYYCVHNSGKMIQEVDDMSDYENKMQWWIISVFTSECTNKLYKMFGNRQMVRNKLVQLVDEDKNSDKRGYGYGAETTYDLYTVENNGMCGYAVFFDYTIRYLAYPYEDIDETDID